MNGTLEVIRWKPASAVLMLYIYKLARYYHILQICWDMAFASFRAAMILLDCTLHLLRTDVSWSLKCTALHIHAHVCWNANDCKPGHFGKALLYREAHTVSC